MYIHIKKTIAIENFTALDTERFNLESIKFEIVETIKHYYKHENC